MFIVAAILLSLLFLAPQRRVLFASWCLLAAFYSVALQGASAISITDDLIAAAVTLLLYPLAGAAILFANHIKRSMRAATTG